MNICCLPGSDKNETPPIPLEEPMTRPLTLCAFFVSALVFAACKDVPIGGDGANSRRDGGSDVAADVAPDAVPCSRANPAVQKCSNTPNGCVPSSCYCGADGTWLCTTDCRLTLLICTDSGSPDALADLAPEAAPDAVPDASSDTVTCGGASPAAQTCRKTANDCIPSSCYCGAAGSWYCTADCPATLPLCADGGAPDLAPDLPSDAYVFPTDEQSCLQATKVPVCDVFPPSTSITSGNGGPLLAKVEVTGGSCTAQTCASGCESINVVGMSGISAGATCDLLVTATDGRSRSLRLSVVADASPSSMCCGYPLDGHGMWTTLNTLSFSPNPIVVDFAGDGGVTTVDGAAPKDGSSDAPSPCAKCSATEVCEQWFDGTCHTSGVFCRAASESCRSKLSASGVKSCKSISECNSEFCSSPYQCMISPPCGTEAPEAALYCYGP